LATDYYSRISSRFWIDTKDWGERNQRVALYLLTNTHRSLEGLYHLPIGYLCSDLNLTPKQAQDAIAFAQKRGLVSFDPEAEVVFIRKALKHGAPKTENHIKGAVRRLRAVPRCSLWDDFLMACECHASELGNAIRMAFEWAPAAHSNHSILSTQYSDTPFIPKGKDPDPVLDVVDDVDPGASLPRKPTGNRKRDLAVFDEQVRAYAAARFPDLPEAERSGYTRAALSDSRNPTHESVEEYVRRWLTPERPAAKEAAA
jgi:hypothetical protein